MWLVAAILSAVFAGGASILAKCGIRKTDSDIATAIRTLVVLVFSWLMVWIVGSAETISRIPARSLLFLLLSGAATGASWICYFKALSLGNVNQVVPIDKSSTVLTILLAMLFLGETEHWAGKLSATILLGAGIFLMLDKQETRAGAGGRYLPYAVGSAVFASLTSILAKIGITGVESNLGTALRTAVVLLMSWCIVLQRGKLPQCRSVDRRELKFILLSGVVTGASWLCYYYAIQNGPVSVVVPVDKMSLIPAIVFSYFVFGEKLSRKAFLGLVLMVLGTLVMTYFA